MAKNTNSRITKLEDQYFGNQIETVFMIRSNPEEAQRRIEQLKKEKRRYFVVQCDAQDLLV